MAALLLLLILQISPLPAQSNSGFPILEPDRQAAEFAHRGQMGPYTWQDLAEISLWASGADAASSPARGQPSYRALIGAAVDELKNTADLPKNERERGEYVLSFMHKKFLKSYSAMQTRIDTILSNGRYNCVSSAVLYLILAGAVNLEVKGVMTRDHAFITVYAGEEAIDVETTNPYGFDPGNRRDFHDDFGKLTGFVYVPARNYRDRTTIGALELVSLILSNRIAELESRNRYAEAVPLAVNRASLLKGRRDGVSSSIFEDPEKDMIDRLLNYGASLINAGKEEDALRWAALAGGTYPSPEWQEFILVAANNHMVKLVRGGRISEARSFLTANAGLLSPANFNQLELMIVGTELTERARQISRPEEAGEILAALDNATAAKQLVPDRAKELRSFVILKAAELLAAAPNRDWLAAIAWLESSIARYGSDPRLEQEIRNFSSNRAADFHNRFAAAYNKRNYDEAEAILREGLAEFPGNRQLQNDRTTVERAAAGRRR
jgi:tetratricopeptide (TPR) repeat protein